MNYNIEIASVIDSVTLTDLTLKSKAYWNYSKEQIEEWTNDLIITKNYISNNIVYKLLLENNIIGYYSCIIITKNLVQLDNLFVHPNYIGKGLGKKLLEHCIKKVKEKNVTTITLDADPNAEQFYLNVGFKVVGQKQSSIKNRFLPIMEFKVQ